MTHPVTRAVEPTPTGRGPLEGIRVLDLTRILAGPTCTQLLGDLGADVVKVERPGRGDDTRGWGPPFLAGTDGPTGESAYYLCANRNKRSITIDLQNRDGQELVRRLAQESDVLIENFKVGGLHRLGLGYADLRERCPRLVYCSVTGFGQTGPRAEQTGYDVLAQAMGGIMSLTGEPEGAPMKVGVGVADVMCGMYAAVGILAALRERDRTGRGQQVDLGLFDTQVAWLVNGALNWLTSGARPRRLGNAHPNIVPYQTFQTADGWLVLAVGNDAQFARFCAEAGRDELSRDARFERNAGRVTHREELLGILIPLMKTRTTEAWVAGLEAVGVPCGPVNEVPEVFDDPQAIHRGMRITMEHPQAKDGTVDLLGNPLKLSETPVRYRRPPPTLGQHTDEVLAEVLRLSPEELKSLHDRDVV